MPDTSSKNTNYLKGLACPKCGHRSPLDITITTTLKANDSGDNKPCDKTWGESSPCTCPECFFSGSIRDFKLKTITINDGGEILLESKNIYKPDLTIDQREFANKLINLQEKIENFDGYHGIWFIHGHMDENGNKAILRREYLELEENAAWWEKFDELMHQNSMAVEELRKEPRDNTFTDHRNKRQPYPDHGKIEIQVSCEKKLESQSLEPEEVKKEIDELEAKLSSLDEDNSIIDACPHCGEKQSFIAKISQTMTMDIAVHNETQFGTGSILTEGKPIALSHKCSNCGLEVEGDYQELAQFLKIMQDPDFKIKFGIPVKHYENEMKIKELKSLKES